MLATLFSNPAQAQAVDYGALEEVFGEPITTSVTGKPQRASEVPGDLVILTQDDIRRSGATDIPGILQFVAGIDVRQYRFGDTQVGIRGYDSPFNPRLLVMVDGRQVYLDDFGYVAWNTIPVQLDEIRQIEVVKGPASALFGYNAASGVINIVTYDPLLDHVNTASVRGGTQGYGAGDAVATVHAGATAGVRISVGGWTANGFQDQTGTADAVPPRYASVNISGRWQAAPSLLLRLDGGDVDSHTERSLPDESTSSTQDQMAFWRLGAAAATRLGTLDADIYRNQSALNFGIVGGAAHNNVVVAKVSDLFKPDADTTFRIGVEYRNNSITNIVDFGGTESYDNFTINGMWDWLISPGYDVTNAVQLDHMALHYSGDLLPTPGRTSAIYNNATITVPSFNSGLVIKVTDADTVRLTAARGLQLPSLINLGLQVDIRGIYLTGSPAVVPTSVWNAELAYDRVLPSIGATFTGAAFFQRNTNLLEGAGNTPLAFVGNILISQAENIGSSNELGLEVGLRGKTEGGFRWSALYRYASITQDITRAAASDVGPNSNYAESTPQHSAIVGAGYTLGRWEMDLLGRWQSSYVDYIFVPPGAREPFAVGNYVTFNARIGYRATDFLTISGVAQQLNQSRLIETSGSTVDRRIVAGANIRF